MSSVNQLLSELNARSVKLWLDGERLRYRSPKGALTTALRQEIGRHKAEIIAFLRQAKQAASKTASTIQAVSRDTSLPLSFAQQRLWFLERLEGPNATYNIPTAHLISGTLNVNLLEASLAEIERRHESLRTTFTMHLDAPTQRIGAASDFRLQVVDLQALPKTMQESEIRQLATDSAQEPFSLEDGPLWRALLLHLGETEHVLLLTIHHIISDGLSMPILMRELVSLYQVFSQGKPSVLPELPIQYADFTVWQRQWLEGEVRENLLDYWKKQLAGIPPLLQLPTDHSRPSVQSFRGSTYFSALPKDVSAKVQALSLESGCSLFMTLLAAFKTLLLRYCGTDDIVVGTPSTNRNRPELEGLIGFFANTLVLRTNLAGNPTFNELLERVREITLDAHKHKELPFEQLIEALQPERNLSHDPLFQVMFILRTDAAKGEIEHSGIRLTPIKIPAVSAKFDLTLEMQESPQGLISRWEYRTDLFERATIERMASHFQTLLASIVANSSQPLAQLPLLSEAERHQLLVEWNDTVADYPQDKCIHQLFEEQVKRTPDAIAVVFGTEAVTYHKLNRRANQLAHYLMGLGVGPEVLVGICVERSLEMVIGLLGILKAGGAYVPLDPTYPQERLQFMWQDSGAEVLLTQSKFIEMLDTALGSNLLCLDQALPKGADSNPLTLVKPEHLAYCIYTSGSTGRPKGVMIKHQSLTNFLHAMSLSPGLLASDKLLAVTTISFDIAALELYLPLIVGAQVILASQEESSDGPRLLEKLPHVTVMQATPATWRMLLASGWQRGNLKVLCGGEALPHDLAQELLARAPELWNMYGPTETTIWSTTTQVTKELASQLNVSIGRPILNTQLYLLDRSLQPVPILVPGELYIGGMGVARGYLKRPELTEERFISNPYGEGRLYKTGDLCRYLPDGKIEFLGRTDHQVKIRGFRIEQGEIEALLLQHEAVREVVVVVRQERASKRLVAYFVAQEPIHSRSLRAYLSQQLPDYMIPSAFEQLEVMPLTPNGKINRRALPTPRQARSETELVLPRTPLETILAAIWQEVLGLKQVGVTDNFFQVGGDSILSLQIVSRAKQAGIQLTPKELFQHQTIAELASVAKEVAAGKTHAEQGVVTGKLPLTPIQHWFLEQNLPKPHHFNQSSLLELTSDVNPKWLFSAIQALLAHHDALRLRFERQEDSWQQVIVAPSPEVPFEVIDLGSKGLSEQVAMRQKQANELQASLNLSQGPLMRVALFQDKREGLPRHANHLLIVIHHLAVDGVSWRILLEDLQRAYQQLASGEAIQLPAKSTSFKQWATLLNDLGPNLVADEREYWAQLSTTQTPPLPVEYRLGPNHNASAANISTRLDRAQTQALLNEVPAVYQTQINDLLLTALLLAWKKWTGQSALLLELEGHGREELFTAKGEAVDLSRTVGWFTTIFPVRLALSTTSRGKAIKSIKEQLRQLPKRGIGYGILRYLSPVELPKVEAQVSFNYLGQFDQIADGPLIKAFASESSPKRSPNGQRTHLLDLNAMVVKGQLQVDWTYSRNFHRAQTIQQLADYFIDALAALIAHCQDPEAGGYTPSDFPDTDLSQEKLELLLAEIALANDMED